MISEEIAQGYCMSGLLRFGRPHSVLLEFLKDKAIASEEKRGVLDGISIGIASSSARRDGTATNPQPESTTSGLGHAAF